MFSSFRFWLSFQLLLFGVRVCPDEHAKNWLKYGLKVAGTGIERDLLEDEGE